ncbi:MAG: GatB/YqeY domain-containing protein, partial [Candidatus Krumholzibacteriia bacterium]
LAARLQAAVIAAMKARDKARLEPLRMMQAQIKQIEVDQRVVLDDAGIVKVLGSYQRKVKEALAEARRAERPELIARGEAEVAIVAEFLPAELDDAALEAAVRAAVAATGATGPQDMGRVMKVVLPEIAGRADGGRVSAAVKRLLQG